MLSDNDWNGSLASSDTDVYVPKAIKCRCLIETSRKRLLVYTSLASPNTGVYAFRAIKCRCIIDTLCETQPTYMYALEQSMQMSHKDIP